MSLFHNGEDVLTKEIESWKGFEYSSSSKGESYTAESLFMALIFQHTEDDVPKERQPTFNEEPLIKDIMH